jgi:hypothetical protein
MGPNCSALECCLTIVSEERETWAAVSLRGLVVGLGFGASWSFGSAMGTEEMLTVTFQNSSRLDYLIRMNVVRRSSGSRSERMCLELVKNERESQGFR